MQEQKNKILFISRTDQPENDVKPLQDLYVLHPDSEIHYLVRKEDILDQETTDMLTQGNVKPISFSDYGSRYQLLKTLRSFKYSWVVLGPPARETGGQGGNQVLALLSGAREMYAYNDYNQLETLNKLRIMFIHLPARLGLTKIYCKLVAMGYAVPGMKRFPLPLKIIIYPLLVAFYKIVLPLARLVYYTCKKYVLLGYYQLWIPALLYSTLVLSFNIYRFFKNTSHNKPVIGIDAKCIGRNITGIERSIFNLLTHVHDQNDLVLRIYTCNPIPGMGETDTLQVRVYDSEINLYWNLGKDFASGAIDVFHVTWQEMFMYHSLPLKLAKKSIYTIFDLINLIEPHYHTGLVRNHYRKILRKSCDWASSILVPSNSTFHLVQKELKAPVDKLKRVYLGVDPQFRQLDHSEAQDYLSRKYQIQRDFLLTVGRSYEHKNLVFLVEVFRELVERKQYPGDLIFIGEKYRYPVNKKIMELIETSGLESRFHWLEKANDKDLLYCYNAAEIFVFPSKHEGFGFPLLEAMACGTPVVSSSATSLPEIVGDAGLIYSPDDHAGFVEGIWRLHNDAGIRDECVAKGFKQVNKFQWNDTANRIIELYKTLLAE